MFHDHNTQLYMHQNVLKIKRKIYNQWDGWLQRIQTELELHLMITTE